MNKNFIFRFLSYVVLLLAPTFWLLSIIIPDAFGWFNFSVACGFVFAGLGLIIIAKNAVLKRFFAYKRLGLIVATIFEIIALVCFVSGFALSKNIIAPIICIIIAVALLIGLFISNIGPRTKWDEGDNHKEGYKNYEQRKVEEKEKQLKEENQKQQENVEVVVDEE